MSQPTRQEADQVRGTLAGIAQRAKSDPTFMNQLRSNPQETLIASGVPEAAVGDVLREEGGLGDVQGYMKCWFTCMTTNSCSLTVST